MTDAETTRRPRLPDAALPPLGGGAAVPLRLPRHGAVLVVLDGDAAPDDAALGYLRQLAGAGETLGGWDGRVLVVVGGDGGAARPSLDGLGLPFPVLADPGRTVAAAAGVTAPALVLTDQWGEAHVATPVGAGGAWMAVGEVEKWLQFFAIRCAG